MKYKFCDFVGVNLLVALLIFTKPEHCGKYENVV